MQRVERQGGRNSAVKDADPAAKLIGMILSNDRDGAVKLAESIDASSKGPNWSAAYMGVKERYEIRERFAIDLLGEQVGSRMGNEEFTIKAVTLNVFYLSDIGLVAISKDGVKVHDNLPAYIFQGYPNRKQEITSAMSELGIGMEYVRQSPSILSNQRGFASLLLMVKAEAEKAGIRPKFYNAREEPDDPMNGDRLSLSALKALHARKDYKNLSAYLKRFGIPIKASDLAASNGTKLRVVDEEVDRNSPEYAKLLYAEMSEKFERLGSLMLAREWDEAKALAKEIDDLMLVNRRSEHTAVFDELRQGLMERVVDNISIGERQPSAVLIVANIMLLVDHGIIFLKSGSAESSIRKITSNHLFPNPELLKRLIERLEQKYGMSGDDIRETAGLLSSPPNLLCALDFLEQKAKEQGRKPKVYEKRTVTGPNHQIELHSMISLKTLNKISTGRGVVGVEEYLGKFGIVCKPGEYATFRDKYLERIQGPTRDKQESGAE